MHPFVQGLLANKNDVIVLTPYFPSLKLSDFPYKIVAYKYIWPTFFHRLGYSQTLSSGMGLKIETYLLAPFLYLFGFFALLSLVKKEQFDIISSHWILPNGFITYLVSLILKIPYTVSLAGSDVYLANKNVFFSFMARQAAEKASVISADSPQYITELKKTGARVKNLYVVPYPVNTNLVKSNVSGVAQLKKTLQISRDAVVLLGVGRLVHKKGFQYLIPAFQRVIQRREKVILIIVGSGDFKGALEVMIGKLKLEEHVRLVGNIERDRIGLYYNAADIFIMPSIKDEQGNIDDRPVALLEAIATGLPVIATNFPGNALSIENKRSGFLIPEKNVDAISAAISQLISSSSLRKSMSTRAKKIAHEQFDMVQVGKKYTRIFNSVVRKI